MSQLKFMLLFIISRWLTETWPLGVDVAIQGRVDEAKGEAGGFQQFDLFSLNTNTNTNLLLDKGDWMKVNCNYKVKPSKVL